MTCLQRIRPQFCFDEDRKSRSNASEKTSDSTGIVIGRMDVMHRIAQQRSSPLTTRHGRRRQRNEGADAAAL